MATITSASEIQTDYMQLLITQLRYQNPLEPMNNQEMAAQLSQFSQLQQLEGMSTSFAKVLGATERTYANSLIGKNISYLAENGFTGAVESNSGLVDEVYYKDDKNYLVVDRYNLGFKDVSESLIGRMAAYFTQADDGTTQIESGIIGDIYQDGDGKSIFRIDGRRIDSSDIVVESFVGQRVIFNVTDSQTGISGYKVAMVNEVYKEGNGENVLVVGNMVQMEDVVSVRK